MHLKWDRVFGRALTSLVAILGVSTTLCAAPTAKKENCREEKPHQFAFAYPKDLNLTNPMDWYAYAEGLLFQGRETGLSFTMTNKTPASSTLNASVGGFSSHHENWDYEFGTRIGIGGYINHDAWNPELSWTWLNITNHQNYGKGGQSTVPLWLPDTGSASTVSTSCGANWQCVMNVLDAGLGKPYHISRKLVFNPHFGLRFAWVDQDYGVDYGGLTSSYRTIFDGKNDFWGVGARLGIDSDWILGKGFKFFTKLSSSVLAGSFDLSEKFTLPSPSTVNVKLKDDFQMVVPNLEMALGLDWGFYSRCHRYYLDFRVGYEFQVWFDQWNLRQILTGTGASDYNFTNVPTLGNLTLNGFTFKIQLDI